LTAGGAAILAAQAEDRDGSASALMENLPSSPKAR